MRYRLYAVKYSSNDTRYFLYDTVTRLRTNHCKSEHITSLQNFRFMHNTEYDINNFYHQLIGSIDNRNDLLTTYPELLV